MSFRHCPRCDTERPLTELHCQGTIDGGPCNWDLTSIPIGLPVSEAAPVAANATDSELRCPGGHTASPGDLICSECGLDLITSSDGEAAISAPSDEDDEHPEHAMPAVIGGWRLESRLNAADAFRETFIVTEVERGRSGVLTLYCVGSEPDPTVHEVLRTMDVDHVPALFATGRNEGRCYEVWEHIKGGSLAELAVDATDGALIRRIVDEIARALADFTRVGLRHRDLKPDAILIRQSDSLDLVITDFGTAQLSEYDLDVVSPLETTRYMAPEAIIGGVSPASDWWSLGMIVLELVTQGRCFEGVHEKAFLIHVIADGAPLPLDLPPDLDLLLRGLLARDRTERWQWDQVSAWQRGEPVAAPHRAETSSEPAGSGKQLGDTEHFRLSHYAFAAATETNWEQARHQLLRGELATWLEEQEATGEAVAAIRNITRRNGLDDDFRLGLALKVLAPNLPLTVRGNLVTPGWLLQNPLEGYRLVTGPAPAMLEMLGHKQSEDWLARLQARAAAVRKRAKAHEIEFDEDLLRPCLLTTSRAALAASWNERRKLFPDTDHRGLSAILGRQPLREEDLIVLLGAAVGQYRSLEEVLQEARELAAASQLPAPDESFASELIRLSRIDVIRRVDARIEGLARCGTARVDEWADQFRLERKIPLARAVVLLSLPADDWQQPAKHDYCVRILEFFEKKVSFSITRGPLARMVIGKTTARIDLMELETERQPAKAILNHLLDRSDATLSLDPEAFRKQPQLEPRMRRLGKQNELYRRDTGIDGLYLGFPFLVVRPSKSSMKPRIAPVLLWPVRFTAEIGRQGMFTIAFDRDREEVRLNPTLENFLGPSDLLRWQAAAAEVLAGDVRERDVNDAFAVLAPPDSRDFGALPSKDLHVEVDSPQLTSAAVLFHVSFMAQAVLEDIRQLKTIPPAGTALATALHLSSPEVAPRTVAPEEPLSSFLTMESDPSQERVVQAARESPGLLVEGPPGTGKSQTIVNVIADSIGRKKSILVVCQKLAALDVVRKRLEGEGLASRIVMIKDASKDRLPVIRAIREQIDQLATEDRGDLQWKRQRQIETERIAGLEQELNDHHQGLRRVDPRTGFSYRQLVGELVGLEANPPAPIDVPTLRDLFVDFSSRRVATLEEFCAPLIRDWLAADYEGSPLEALKPFAWDPPTVARFRASLDTFVEAEEQRARMGDREGRVFVFSDPEAARRWIADHGTAFHGLEDTEAADLARWIGLFECEGKDQTPAEQVRKGLQDLVDALSGLEQRAFDEELAGFLVSRSTDDVKILGERVQSARARTGFIGRLNPIRYLNQLRVRSALQILGREADSSTMTDLAHAIELELTLRPKREGVAAVLKQLGESRTGLAQLSPKALRARAAGAASALSRIARIAPWLEHCPNQDALIGAAVTGSAKAIGAFIDQLGSDLRVHDTRVASKSTLTALGRWMQDAWVTHCHTCIEAGATTDGATGAIRQKSNGVAAYQKFRAKSTTLTPDAWTLLSQLHLAREALAALPTEQVEEEVRRIINREARLAWKTRLEFEQPLLLQDPAELKSKVRRLAKADLKLRQLNRHALIEDVDHEHLADSRWTGITRLSGPRSRRLREFIEAGTDLGLLELRPVWLMNPDTASRVLPLKAGLFDIVIFDEASQMPVEHALPALFRGRIVVVSGDEKQLPPTSFFSSRIESDEAEVYDGEPLSADATEEEQEAAEEEWNRREVKDCPDLLSLGRTVLPSRTLEIHYRSRFRELVDFSNASFYQRNLHVPVTHPDSKITQERPIRLIRVDGVYENQTNPEEADRVVNLLHDMWADPSKGTPTVGVVTFNRKQADLIIERLETHAEQDDAFRDAYAKQLQRTVDGEDVGFFVKNVENVQGDERDVIVFSSTFGRNSHGNFRRNFGVLGQKGGERRLNVAVTRARDRIVLVTSIPISEVSDLLTTRNRPNRPRDYLQAYLEYAQRVSDGKPDLGRRLLDQICNRRTELGRKRLNGHDAFTGHVAEFIQGLGWTAVRGHEEGPFTLDLAIEHRTTAQFGNGIESDPPQSLILDTARAREIWRPSVLKGSIPVIHRVSSRSWYHDPGNEQRRLEQAISRAIQ